MQDQPILETERLRLRPFCPGDAPRVRELAGDQRVADVTAHIPHPYPEGAAEAWIATHTNLWEHRTGVVYAMTLTSDTSVIGTTSVVDINAGEGELGYWLGVPYWGRGYCTEAVRALLAFLAGSRLLRHVNARHLSRNPASGRVLAKSEFVHQGRVVTKCGYRRACEPVEVYRRDL